MLLLNGRGFLVLLVSHLLLELLSLHILVGLHVGVKDHPLGGLQGEVGADGRVGLNSLFSHGEVHSLGGPLLEIELISQGFLD